MGVTVFVAVTIVFAVVTIAFGALCSVSRKVHLVGMVVPLAGSANVMAPISGTIRQRFVGEGELVSAGQALFEVIDERRSADGSLDRAVLDSIAGRRDSLKSERVEHEQRSREAIRALHARLASMDQEIAQLAARLRSQGQKVEIAKAARARLEDLVSKGFVSDAQVEAKKAEELDAQAQRQDLDRAATVLARERQDVLAKIDMESRTFAIERQQLTRAQRELGQQAAEAEARRSATIASPVDGRIGALDLKPGQAVRAGQNLATIIKGSARGEVFEVYLFAPSRSVGLLREQQVVHIRYDAFPYAKYGAYRGRITSISAAPLSAAQLSPEMAPRLAQMEQSADVYYRIKVALGRQQISLANHRLELLSGMTLQADIVIERRRIWEWLVAPLAEASQSLEVLSATGGVDQ